MKIAQLVGAALMVFAFVGISASVALADSGTATGNNKLHVQANGLVAFFPTVGEFKSSPGGPDVPVCTGSSGFLILSQNSAGTVYSDAVKDRFVSIIMSAILSGKKMTITFTRTASNACYVDNVWLNV